ncbi:MAG TPA: HlyD family efflux transporter periplasmic adaptor subunit, partial [Longimicrobiales bacterium]
PQERIVYRVAEDARVETVSVAQGAVVPAGAVLAVLRNPQLELQWTQTQAAVASLERVVQVSARDRDFAGSRAAELELAARRAMLERLRVRREALVMRAPFAGRIVTPHPERLAGATIEAGDSILELHRAAPLLARVYLTERDAGDLDRGDIVRIKFPVRASWTWQSTIGEVSSAARNGYLELMVPLARSDSTGPLRAGMTGKAKVAARRTTVAGAVLWNVRRTFRTDLWL